MPIVAVPGTHEINMRNVVRLVGVRSTLLRPCSGKYFPYGTNAGGIFGFPGSNDARVEFIFELTDVLTALDFAFGVLGAGFGLGGVRPARTKELRVSEVFCFDFLDDFDRVDMFVLGAKRVDRLLIALEIDDIDKQTRPR